MDHPHDDDTPDDSPEARFGAELRRLRVKAELSLRELADRLHRAHSTISEFESGRRLPGVEVVEQYEEYFKLPRGTLVAQRERARAARLESPRDATLDEHLGDVDCPYKGLFAFEDEDAALFFGREQQVAEVLTRLDEVRFVAVLGASGSGKSSFVRAGLVAAIKAKSTGAHASARVALLTPGADPLDELADAVSAAIGDGAPIVAEDLCADPGALQRATRNVDAGLVIAVDQFEELFTLCGDEDERRCFVDALIGAWRDPSSPVVVILALRADFYGRIATYPDLAAAVVAHQTLIGPMTAVDLRRAIELPAATTGLAVQPGLVETILEDLAGEPGALPLLSHALLETWKRRRRVTLTVAGYHEAGGVRGAIAQTAERTLQTLPEADRPIARTIFLSLTDIGEGVEPTRRRVDRTELVAHPQSADWSERVLAILTEARLVSVDERTVVVAHEALVRHWPRLRGWIDADRAGLLTHRRLTDAAREWDTLHREPGALYRGARLATARDWATDHPDRLSQLERDFLTTSRAAEDRRTRRLRAIAAGLATSTLIVAALAAWAFHQRTDAQRQASNRTSLALASLSNGPLTTRPDVSLALAFEAYREVPRPEARSAVIRAILAARRSHLRGFRTIPTTFGAALSPDVKTLAFAAGDRAVRLWDFATGKQVGVLHGRGSAGRAIAFSTDGKMLAAGGGDTVRLWDLATGRQRAILHVHAKRVLAVAFSHDGKLLASAGDSDRVRLWDLATGRQRAVLHVHAKAVFALAFSHDGKLLASGGDDHHQVRLWDLATGKQLAVLRDAGAGSGVAFSPDDKMLASTSDDSVRLWDLAARRQVAVLQVHAGVHGIILNLVEAVVFSNDGKTLAAAGLDGTVSLWDPAIRSQLAALRGHRGTALALAFSPDGTLLASADNDGRTMRLWDAASRKRLAVLHAHADAVAFSRDGGMLASASRDSTVRLWNPATGEQLAALDGHALVHRGLQPPFVAVAFSPDGTTLASASGDSVRLWSVATRKRLAVLHLENWPFSVAFSRDGKMLAVGSDLPTVSLWNPATGKRLAVLHGPLGPARAVAFSPDGTTLAVANSDTTVTLWDLATRTQLAVLHGHTGSVTAVAFSDDGTMLASASDDKTVRLWDRATQTELARLSGHTAPVGAIAFNPDGKSLASAGTDMKLHSWHDVLWQSQDQLHATVCDILLTGLRRSDWEQYAPGIPYRRSCP